MRNLLVREKQNNDVASGIACFSFPDDLYSDILRGLADAFSPSTKKFNTIFWLLPLKLVNFEWFSKRARREFFLYLVW